MKFNEYQFLSRETAFYAASPAIVNDNREIDYCLLKLNGEAGECAELYGKFLRDGTPFSDMRNAMEKELGDVLWYVAQLCTELDMSMENVAASNIRKLTDRRKRGVLGGSGDER